MVLAASIGPIVLHVESRRDPVSVAALVSTVRAPGVLVARIVGSRLRWPLDREERAHARSNEPDPEAVAILRVGDGERARDVLLDRFEGEKQLLGP